MVKKEVIEKISKYFRLTEFEAERVYDDIFSIIMNGVREDNIVDIANFGEFIIKYNNGRNNGEGYEKGYGNGYKRTVEFLASSSVEEELNQTGFVSQVQTSAVTPQIVNPQDKPVSGEETVPEPPLLHEKFEHEQPVAHEKTEPEQAPAYDDKTEESSIEEELRRKREEILSKITGPILPGPTGFKIEETQKDEPPSLTEEPKPQAEEMKPEEMTQEIFTPETSISPEEKAPEEVDDLSRKTFSDYLSEVTPETKKVIEEPVVEPEREEFIPKTAVILHNEIVSQEPPTQAEPEKPMQQQAAGETEHRAKDESYYIWYKDSESNPTDTQALSYEYELLYQASKEAEYKSKLKIYVSTFILFFSIVLLLLIFSPLIYKVFFSPSEFQTTESVQPETQGGISDQKGTPNVLEETGTTQQNQTQVIPPADTTKKTEQVTVPPVDTTKKTQPVTVPPVNNQQQQKQVKQTPPVTKEEKKPEEKKKPDEKPRTETQQKPTQQVEKKPEGLSKNSMGWADEKLKVIYVQLENGKFTIQESAWDSDAKANKRISVVESLGIAGIKGSMVKADLGAKGIWYRVRFGEFSTLDEAQKKAEEFRNKERAKLHTMLFACLFLYA